MVLFIISFLVCLFKFGFWKIVFVCCCDSFNFLLLRSDKLVLLVSVVFFDLDRLVVVFLVGVVKLIVGVLGFVVGVDVNSLVGSEFCGWWIEFGGIWELFIVLDFNLCKGYCVSCFLFWFVFCIRFLSCLFIVFLVEVVCFIMFERSFNRCLFVCCNVFFIRRRR